MAFIGHILTRYIVSYVSKFLDHVPILFHVSMFRPLGSFSVQIVGVKERRARPLVYKHNYAWLFKMLKMYNLVDIPSCTLMFYVSHVF